MKVWIVTEWPPYEGEEIVAVFDSHEKAQAFVDLRDAHWDGHKYKHYVELYEWDVE